jgi:P4 family phage/plasmid primase-like protien
METPDLLTAALALHEAGLCVLPAATDGSKRPAVDWKRWQHERPDVAQLTDWLTSGRYDGIGVVAGAVSGNVEMTELEGRAAQAGALARILDIATEAGDRELIDRLLAGYVVISPSGGIHIVYRVGEGFTVPGNTKLAATAEHVTLAETRGEGGWYVTAPSFGRTHPTHRPWALATAGVIPTITADERDRFHALVRTLDERPVAAPSTPNPFAPLSRAGSTDGISPGDDYNARTTWDEVLTADGWTRAFTRGEVTMWRRPGKTHGISATTGHMGDWLYPFTSSTVLEPERTYTRFGYLAAWTHGGDHAKAAQALQSLGYGRKATVVQLQVPAPALAPTADGITVPAPEHEATVTPLTAAFGLTDIGNARLFVAVHGHRLRYVPERSDWLVWTGARWEVDTLGEHVELAKDVLEDAARQADDKVAAQHFARSMTRRGLEAMIALARTDPNIRVTINLLDANPSALCTPGGVVDLRTGELHPAAPDELHTRSTPVAPAAMATPRWDAFLADTYGGDAELIGYVQRLAGYSASGDVSAHILPFLYGPSGQNGKSVLMEVLVTLLGGYATTAPGSFLTQGPGQHEAEIARLHGARLVACSETEAGARFAEAKVKMLTGGDRITARFLYGSHFSYDPTAKLWLMANDRPAVSSGGTSFWRRLRLINHPHKVPDAKRIDGLAQILIREEGPGILAWIVAGAVAYYADGLHTPASVKAATAGYAHDEDDLGRFIEQRLIVGPITEVATPTNVITAAYHRWCADEGVEPVNAKRFGMDLRTRCGAQLHRTNGRRFYLGIAVAADEHESIFTPLPRNPTL